LVGAIKETPWNLFIQFLHDWNLSLQNISGLPSSCIHNLFHFQVKTVHEGVKYLGFMLKANYYRYEDWLWIYKKVEKCISVWMNKLLARGGHLVLV